MYRVQVHPNGCWRTLESPKKRVGLINSVADSCSRLHNFHCRHSRLFVSTGNWLNWFYRKRSSGWLRRSDREPREALFLLEPRGNNYAQKNGRKNKKSFSDITFTSDKNIFKTQKTNQFQTNFMYIKNNCTLTWPAKNDRKWNCAIDAFTIRSRTLDSCYDWCQFRPDDNTN